LRKAAATSYPHEAAACRDKAEAYAPSTASSTDEPTVTPGPASHRAGERADRNVTLSQP
jgi:hypothetical protein